MNNRQTISCLRTVVVITIAVGAHTPALADFATLVDQTTIIDNIPIGSIGPEDGFGIRGFAVNRGNGIKSGFIDAAVLSYDFGAVTSVISAELTLTVDTIFAEAGMNPTIEMFVYTDDGTIQLTDIFLGAGTVEDSFTYNMNQVRTIDVTNAVNGALMGGQFVGFRFENSRSPFDLPNALEGIHYALDPPLEFVIPAPGDLDIKPGSCPNSYNRNSHGVLPVALVGTDSFDVSLVDLGSLLLVRTDGEGGSVAPNFGPPGPHPTIDDVATPFEGEECDCHEATGDGIPDLMMHFRTDDVVANLDLNSFAPGALVSLTLTGTTLDGTEFEADDCVRLVPPGTPPALLAVTSNRGAAGGGGPCPTDITGDGAVNVLDLIDLLLCFGQPAPPCDSADVNNDGTVNVLDLIELLLAFGTDCP